MDTRTILMCSPSMQGLAVHVRDAMSFGQMQSVAIQRETFPDGWPNMRIKNADVLEGRNVVYLLGLKTKKEVFDEMSVLYALPRHHIRSLLIVLPYFPVGTMDRVEEYGQIVTAKSLWRMLEAVPPCSTGIPRIITYDIHALQEQFYPGDSIMPMLRSAVPILKEEWLLANGSCDWMIAFPDSGAQKRFGKMFPDHESIVCDKRRIGVERVVVILDGDPSGRDVLVVDDMIQSGLTMMAAGRVLCKAGARKVCAYATHGVFPKKSWRNFIACEVFDRVIITDTVPWRIPPVQDGDPFKVLSIAASVAREITKFEVDYR